MKLHVLCPQLWIDAQQSITITAPAFSAMGVPTVTRAVPAAHQPHPQGPAGTCRLRAAGKHGHARQVVLQAAHAAAG